MKAIYLGENWFYQPVNIVIDTDKSLAENISGKIQFQLCLSLLK